MTITPLGGEAAGQRACAQRASAVRRRRGRQLAGVAVAALVGGLVWAAARPAPSLQAAAGGHAVHGVAGLGDSSGKTPGGDVPDAQSPAVCSAAWLADLAAHRSAALIDRQAPPSLARSPGASTMSSRGGSDAVPMAIARPNDTYFSSYQTHSLKAIGALDAWETSYGGDDVTVAIISSGMEYDHPDLAANLWHNVGEVPGNARDDDGNGYVDDTIGWDFAENNADPSDFPLGQRGTMLAGIVAAETHNNRGIAGTSWHAKLMPLKVLFEYTQNDGTKVAAGRDRDVIAAVCYAANNGAGVILIGPTIAHPDYAADTIVAMQAAIDYASIEKGAFVVAPAGDCGGDPWADGRMWCPDPDLYGENGENPDIQPAGLENVLGVQSVGIGFQRRPSASWGPWVDISAPGEEFMTTGLDDGYEYIADGRPAVSDFAAAQVAGVVAVMRSVTPGLSPYRTLLHLCAPATKVGDGYEPTPGGDWTRNDRYGCGVVNFERAVESLPMRVHGVTPARLDILTDTRYLRLEHHFRNPYLNRGKWQLTPAPGSEWLSAAVSSDPKPGQASLIKLTTDIELLREQSGGEIAGNTYKLDLLACPAEGPSKDDPASCQTIPFSMRVVQSLSRLYLPRTLARAP